MEKPFLHIGAKFDPEVYQRIEQRATENYNLDNNPGNIPSKLLVIKFALRERTTKLVEETRNFFSRFRFSKRFRSQNREEANVDVDESVSETPQGPSAEANVCEAREYKDNQPNSHTQPSSRAYRYQTQNHEKFPVEKGMVKRLVLVLEPFFAGMPVREELMHDLDQAGFKDALHTIPPGGKECAVPQPSVIFSS